MESEKKKFSILPEVEETLPEGRAVGMGRFPSWLHRKLPTGTELLKTRKTLGKHALPTVCEEAKCPNLLECWSKKTATFLVLGKECTRACGFCEILTNPTPGLPDPEEPGKLADSVKTLGLEHVVLTQVARDDLPDGGARHLKECIVEIRRQKPKVSIEVLTSDFQGDEKALEIMIEARPDVFNHNIETVERLTSRVRHKATYRRSLKVLSFMRPYMRKIKSGLMVGLGETSEEVLQTLRDLKEAGVEIVTLGQYLQPSRKKLRVKEFVTEEQFAFYQKEGERLGLSHVYSGPFVRSSYNAKEVFSWNQKG